MYPFLFYEISFICIHCIIFFLTFQSIHLYFVNTKPINVINEVSMEENTQNDIYSMVIYFVKPGDTLWKIAKKFKSKIDDIARVNNIEDENLIKPGQQLYIPKFARRNIAV